MLNSSEEEKKIYNLLSELLHGACPIYNEQSLSVRFITMMFASDTVHVWGGPIHKAQLLTNLVTEFFGNIWRTVGKELAKARASPIEYPITMARSGPNGCTPFRM